MRSGPVRQALRQCRFGVGVAGRTENSDEQLRVVHFAGEPVHDLDCLSGVVDEHLIAGQMSLTHGRRQAAFPAPVKLAELAVAVTVRMDASILLPQKHERYTGPAPLTVDRRPVGPWPFLRLACLWRWGKPLFECLVRQLTGQRPAEAGMLGTLQILPCARAPDAQVTAICRFDSPAACSRNASLILRIGNLFIRLPAPSKGSEPSPPKDHPTVQIGSVHRVAGCPGIGGRIRSDSLAVCARYVQFEQGLARCSRWVDA